MAAKREEVEEMELFGGAAGKKDEEVVMTANPLKLQLQDLTMQQAKGLSALSPPVAAAAATEGEAGSQTAGNGELDSLKAAQASHRAAHIGRLHEENSRMAREMDELRQLLQPTNVNKTSEEEKEQQTE